MTDVAAIQEYLTHLAPPALAESWDNVGLLTGDQNQPVSRILTCLTLTPDVAAEAIAENADLIISHHPILFRPIQQITSNTVEGKMLLALIQAEISVYSPHTSYDSAEQGINWQLAQLLGLEDIGILRPLNSTAEPELPEQGAGRFGSLPAEFTLAQVNQLIKQALKIDALQFVGDPGLKVQRVGIACGAAAEFLKDAHQHDCQVLLTGEARFHACLEARALGMGLILPGHYATERPAMEQMAHLLQQQFPKLTTWASQKETDPLQWDCDGE
ncbi:Nif3-like dinuclear metal center hexameric protein [Gimesia sp.]|uniref:Nif3-like dinuclear metal center hexameric protein n=1 Tax=Gimesia sp. TaxID=2024833 RepID=UPI000C45FD40|nr:Nif3-like dinuclear metal center hexameric protein [Gimesia sp.]MAX37482.1 Nif3-like dinuclear metal center hexameric protein [Gimesia sp.]HBL46007.1 Nif3-like dinuclear metal center hexameric protein [Planctomycetaceae bacterium]|tara:strand:- start:6018 stop:6833 length:816 start_codon:yes stop_codon:yes gene_type:complete